MYVERKFDLSETRAGHIVGGNHTEINNYYTVPPQEQLPAHMPPRQRCPALPGAVIEREGECWLCYAEDGDELGASRANLAREWKRRTGRSPQTLGLPQTPKRSAETQVRVCWGCFDYRCCGYVELPDI